VDFLERANNDENVVEVFGDPIVAAMESLAVCPSDPVGTDLDVEQLLLVEELYRRGMDGAGVPVYPADGGTSAATPVAAGVVAAIRRLYPASVLSSAQLRDLLRDTAEPQGDRDFDYEFGHGVINVQNLLDALEEI
jgi:subtilisin family serine protease